jgi:hypothetical protein
LAQASKKRATFFVWRCSISPYGQQGRRQLGLGVGLAKLPQSILGQLFEIFERRALGEF